MKTSLFNYYLPKKLIAQEPVCPRDHSRLLVLHRKSGKIEHKIFFEILEYFKPGDLLVLNNTKVIPARFMGREESTGGKVEILLLRPLSDGEWEVLIGGRTRQGLVINFNNKLSAEILSHKDSIYALKFNSSGGVLDKLIKKIGKTPTPPYIKKISKLSNYQTVYAKKEASAAAPTAGLHFTTPLLSKIKKMGVEIEYITLHVGLGTFAPIKTEKIEDHKIHSEWFELKKSTAAILNKAKKEKRRIIAVGTTTARVLETCFKKGRFIPSSGFTDLYIYPGYKIKTIDGLITNFHLPKSSLILLISAFAGRDKIFKTYNEAIKRKYRFYSFGDAMLIV